MSEQFNSPPSPDYTNMPPANAADVSAPQMSTPATLTGIFFEPSTTFDALRARPRFLVAALITLALAMTFYTLYVQRVGHDNIVRARVDSNPNLTPEQRDQAIEAQSRPLVKNLEMLAPILVLAIIFAAGAALYLAGVAAMGGRMTYKQALAVWAYSSFPPAVLGLIANLIVLFIKSPEDIDPVKDARGLVHANPSLLIDSAAHPVLATLLGSLDLFAIYGLILAAIGLRRVGRLSSGSAWSIVLGLFVLGVVLRVAFALASGQAM